MVKLITKLTEIDKSTTLLILNELIKTDKWLGLKEINKISKYYPIITQSIQSFIENGMIMEKLEPYNCDRKKRKLWRINKENDIIKLMEKEI